MSLRSTAAILFALTIPLAAYSDPKDDLKDTSKFFEKAASASQLEIESGRLAAQRASSPALKQFGQKMVTDHSQSSQELGMLASSKGVTLPAVMSDSDRKKLDKLREEKPGKDFDNRFRDLMIDSHKDAVSLFEDTAENAKEPQVKAFAGKMLPKLQHHEQAAKALPKA